MFSGRGMNWGHSVVRLYKALCAGTTDTRLFRIYAEQIGAPKSLAEKSLVVY
jgi:hypothetical protein